VAEWFRLQLKEKIWKRSRPAHQQGPRHQPRRHRPGTPPPAGPTGDGAGAGAGNAAIWAAPPTARLAPPPGTSPLVPPAHTP